ncbi:ECF transporter S component [Crassaminicella thermophila]|uniref:ECF transporter S component n=1 Tax=Crassaminicella thermophila TaxID=2599308 RepID=A0A5C0SDN3_CRATE|nr:ECF transporter S component [Crassaminicella thermophila]QEK12381.1 ECF transporter S component [Crassaminicella thermophila]
MHKCNVKQLTISGLMAALVLVGTMLIQVPTPTKGYIHIGDSMVYLSGVLLGPVAGSLAAAMGSMLADVFSGYGIYAPATFVIKGLDAFIVAYIYNRLVKSDTSSVKKIVFFACSVLAGGGVMVVGYLAYESVLYGFNTAILGVLGNITQAVGGAILAAPLVIALEKINLFQKLKENFR